MGKVFTWDEVASGRVPKPDSFLIACRLIRNELEKTPLIGGVICGSVNRKDHTERSDIDCLVLYPDEAAVEMKSRIRVLKKQVEEELFVPLDFIHLTPLLAQSSRHTISPSFAHHVRLSLANGGIVKEDPFQHTELFLIDHRTESIDWCRQKKRSLDDGESSCYSDEREALFLKRLLEAPVNGARKLLLAGEGFENDSKETVLCLTRERYPDLADELSHFVGMDKVYTEVLRQQLRCPDPQSYSRTLVLIRNEAHAVGQFLLKILSEIEKIDGQEG